MLEKINAIKEEINAAVATNLQEVEELRIKYLSKKGSISQLMVDFRTVPAEMKRELAQKINELKNYATEKIASLKEGFALPPIPMPKPSILPARRHPMNLAHVIRFRLSRMKC